MHLYVVVIVKNEWRLTVCLSVSRTGHGIVKSGFNGVVSLRIEIYLTTIAVTDQESLGKKCGTFRGIPIWSPFSFQADLFRHLPHPHDCIRDQFAQIHPQHFDALFNNGSVYTGGKPLVFPFLFDRLGIHVHHAL